ncbi:hypothetical protein L1987_62106 [Smallanthus sonchifolius]|uniref:Uncharacterized protein n=1 Tax=Smallanthus sonchifolius TaxID=185202 RepID=A0ACB9C9N8_9ASTR|nr:hypothetical protein L1987_62106 [Smallanthus sonchifolius]
MRERGGLRQKRQLQETGRRKKGIRVGRELGSIPCLSTKAPLEPPITPTVTALVKEKYAAAQILIRVPSTIYNSFHKKMPKSLFIFSLFLLLLIGASTAAPHTSTSRIVNGVFSNVASALMKWAWSLKATAKTTIGGRPMMKFESGYDVETVFDGSKLGIEPHALEVLPNGELLVLDSANSNLYKISSSLSLYSRPKLIAGSADGHSGHVDGKLREAKMNHPKGLTVDDKGNIYIADTANMAIRKISDAGVTTIAGGGKVGRGGHVDGPSEDAKFSNDFDVLYIGSSCSLLVIDRGNQAIREIQLPFDDCAYQYGSGFPIGIVVLVAAGFFGYMLAMLQRRDEPQITMNPNITPTPPYQKPTLRPPLIPTENEPEKQDEGFIASLGKLTANAMSSFSEILTNVFPGFKKKQLNYPYQNQPPFHQNHKFGSNPWPVQDSFVIPAGDEPPPSIETRTPTPKKTYPFMTSDAEKIQQFRQSRHLYSGWDRDYQQPQQQPLQQPQQQQHHNRYYSSIAETYYEESREKTNEIVFGAVQEQAESMVIKPLDHANSVYDRRGKTRSRGFAHAD